MIVAAAVVLDVSDRSVAVVMLKRKAACGVGIAVVGRDVGCRAGSAGCRPFDTAAAVVG